MTKKEYAFDLLTLTFAVGADQMRAEIRASEVRGILRWWFRVLGGFKDDSREVRKQELDVFGGVFGDNPIRSKLVVRVQKDPALTSQCGDADSLGAGINSPLGYLLFPLRGVRRGFFRPNDPQRNKAFSVSVLWNGDETDFPKIEALVTVFGKLGSLGFRSRRCMGAVGFHGPAPMELDVALGFFAKPNALEVRELPQTVDGEPMGTADKCVKGLAVWYKKWRSYGPASGRNDFKPGFEMAKIDHDIGLNPKRRGSAVRPALGLPIIQHYSHSQCNTWAPSDGDRFASPVILRPCKTKNGACRALVIFVEAMSWTERATVKVRDTVVPVSLDLYRKMKEDRRLVPVEMSALA